MQNPSPKSDSLGLDIEVANNTGSNLVGMDVAGMSSAQIISVSAVIPARIEAIYCQLHSAVSSSAEARKETSSISATIHRQWPDMLPG